MPCIFCLAVLALLAGSVTASWLDLSEERLQGRASSPVIRSRQTESVCVWDFTATVDDKTTAVTVTVYTEEKRVRIQVHSHDLDDEQVKRLEDELALLLEAQITERADQEGLDHSHEEEEEAEEAAELEPQPVAEPERIQRR